MQTIQPVCVFLSLFQLFTDMKSTEVPSAVSFLRDFAEHHFSVCHCASVCTSYIQALREGGREDGFPGRKVL